MRPELDPAAYQTASKTGLNREMAYSRMGEFRIQLEWQMKKKGGISRRVESAHTSQKMRCLRGNTWPFWSKVQERRNHEQVHCRRASHADGSGGTMPTRTRQKTFWIMTVSRRRRLAAKPTGIVEAPLQVSAPRSSQGARITDRMVLE